MSYEEQGSCTGEGRRRLEEEIASLRSQLAAEKARADNAVAKYEHREKNIQAALTANKELAEAAEAALAKERERVKFCAENDAPIIAGLRDRVAALTEKLAKAEARLKLCDDGTPDARGKFRVIEAESQVAALTEKVAALEKDKKESDFWLEEFRKVAGERGDDLVKTRDILRGIRDENAALTDKVAGLEKERDNHREGAIHFSGLVAGLQNQVAALTAALEKANHIAARQDEGNGHLNRTTITDDPKVLMRESSDYATRLNAIASITESAHSETTAILAAHDAAKQAELIEALRDAREGCLAGLCVLTHLPNFKKDYNGGKGASYQVMKKGQDAADAILAKYPKAAKEDSHG